MDLCAFIVLIGTASITLPLYEIFGLFSIFSFMQWTSSRICLPPTPQVFISIGQILRSLVSDRGSMFSLEWGLRMKRPGWSKTMSWREMERKNCEAKQNSGISGWIRGTQDERLCIWTRGTCGNLNSQAVATRLGRQWALMDSESSQIPFRCFCKKR